MKLIFFLAVLLVLSACGKQESSSSKGKELHQQNVCNLNGAQVSCDALDGADGLGIDLLDTTVDVGIDLTDSEVIFRESKSQTAQGRRINCKTSVRIGEKYQYSLNGNTLDVTKDDGESFRFERLNGGSSILGAWAVSSYIDQGTHIIRQITFVSNDRAILKTHCEF